MMIVEDRAMLDIDDVAEQLNVSAVTIRRLVRSKKLRAYRIGGQLRFKQEDIDAYLESALVSDKDEATEE